MQMKENWADIKKLFGQAFRSSFHYALATVNEDGEPHVTPIGSLILCDPGHGSLTLTKPDRVELNSGPRDQKGRCEIG